MAEKSCIALSAPPKTQGFSAAFNLPKPRSSMKLQISLILILGLSLPQAIDPQVEKIKRNVAEIGILQKITVVFTNGNENYGTVSRIEQDRFAINDVDLQREIEIGYDEVKKVRKNYGRRGILGKRPNPMWGWIAGILLFGTIIGLAIALGGGD